MNANTKGTNLNNVPTQELNSVNTYFPTPKNYVKTIESLKSSGYKMCSDLTAVDYLEAKTARVLPEGITPERFEVVVNLLSLSSRERVRVRVQVAESNPELPTLFDLYPGTEALEREVYDLFGISFVGHPDMTRILMPDDWEGHPLRKDYSQQSVPVQFKFPAGKYSEEDATANRSVK